VPSAKITLTNSGTGLARTANTDSDDRYSLTNLNPGTYVLRAAHEGFKSALHSTEKTSCHSGTFETRSPADINTVLYNALYLV
jgi:hypothetical protein